MITKVRRFDVVVSTEENLSERDIMHTLEYFMKEDERIKIDSVTEVDAKKLEEVVR